MRFSSSLSISFHVCSRDPVGQSSGKRIKCPPSQISRYMRGGQFDDATERLLGATSGRKIRRRLPVTALGRATVQDASKMGIAQVESEGRDDVTRGASSSTSQCIHHHWCSCPSRLTELPPSLCIIGSKPCPSATGRFAPDVADAAAG